MEDVGALVLMIVVYSYTVSAPLVLCPLKNIPPSKNLVFCFFVFKKLVSKLEAEVDEVSFETLT